MISQPPVRLIYSSALGTLRRGVVFDAFEELSDPALNAGSGEEQIDISRSEYDAIGTATRSGGAPAKLALQEIINRHTGRDAIPELHDRFCVIDTYGDVIGVLLGDPACGFEGAEITHSIVGRIIARHTIHRFIHHPEAEIGWRFDDERGFIAPEQQEPSE